MNDMNLCVCMSVFRTAPVSVNTFSDWHGITAAAQCVSQEFRFGPMALLLEHSKKKRKKKVWLENLVVVL